MKPRLVVSKTPTPTLAKEVTTMRLGEKKSRILRLNSNMLNKKMMSRSTVKMTAMMKMMRMNRKYSSIWLHSISTLLL